MPPTRRTTSSIVDVRADDARVLRAAQQRLAGGVEHRAAAGEDRRRRARRSRRARRPAPASSRRSRRSAAASAVSASQGSSSRELARAARQRLDLVDVDGLHEVGARREVAVQRPDADAGAAGDVLERGRAVGLGERLARGGHELLVVAQRVGALRAIGERVACGRRAGHRSGLDKAEGSSAIVRYRNRRHPPKQVEASSGSSVAPSANERPRLAPHPLPGAGTPRAARTRCLRTPAPDARPRRDPRHLPDDRPRRSVVITALPSIRERLDFSPAALSWVQSAYALTFGGLLLLGARMGDILGRRRTFVAGIALFTFASLARRPRPVAGLAAGRAGPPGRRRRDRRARRRSRC